MDFVTEGNFLKVPSALGSPWAFPIFLTLLLPGKLSSLVDQWFLTEGYFALRGHLKMSRDVQGLLPRSVPTSIHWVEVRDATKCPTVPRTVPQQNSASPDMSE